MFQIFCDTQYSGTDTNVIGVNPVSADSLERTIELCFVQGTVCVGAFYGLSASDWAPQALTKQTMNFVTLVPGFTSALRKTGPAGQSANQLTNGDFQDVTLLPWVSGISNGASFQAVDGNA